MASAWGAWVHTDDWRCGVNAWVVSETSTAATIRVQNIFENVYLIGSRSGNSVRCSCDGATRSADMPLGTNYGHTGQKVIKTEDFTVSKRDSARNVSCGATIVVSSGSSGTSSASVSVRIGAISYSKPADPSSCAAVREGDSKVSVTWVNGATDTLTPRTATLVERSTDGGDFAQIASVGKDVENYTDNGTEQNHIYSYRVRAQGSGGYSNYSTSESIYTTPAAPLSAVATKVMMSTVRVSADTSNVKSAVGYEVEASENGGDWYRVATVDFFPITTEIAGVAIFRVRSVNGDLKSGWTESNEIATITPPLAPNVTGLPEVAAIESEQTVRWVPNHPDTSEQTSAQVEFTKDGSVQTVDIGSELSCTVPQSLMSSAGVVSVRVRTKGLDPSWGAWSSPVTMSVAVPPSVVTTSPASDGAVIESLPMTVSWTAVDSTGVSEQVITLKDSDGTVLWTATVPSSIRSFDIPYRLDNMKQYSITLTVRGGSSLTASSVRTFATDYAEPDVPYSYIEVNTSNFSTSITVNDGKEPGSGKPDAKSFTVTRILPDGTRWVVARNLLDGQQATDPLPPLNVDFSYEVVAISDMGTQSVLTTDAYVDSDGSEVFSFGPDAMEALVLQFDANASISSERTGELFRFAMGSGSTGLPTFYADGELSVSGRRSYVVFGKEDFNRARNIARSQKAASCWYRDAYGGRAFVHPSFGFSYAAGKYDAFDVTANLTECVFEEPWNA